jgi:hypothetical protein
MAEARKAFVERLFAHRGALQAFFYRRLRTKVFDAYDTDSFAAFLETLHGVVVQKTPTRIRVRSVVANRERQAAVR